MLKLESPVTYQGGKTRIASIIIDHIKPTGTFYDLCCGSGAITLELINRGYPYPIHMVDSGPWGLFWESIANKTFSLARMEDWCQQIPSDKTKIKGFMEELSKVSPSSEDVVYIFLLLQAASFGGKAIWLENNRWKNCSFRNYWLPTATSSRRSPVNPMMPMADTLINRLEKLVKIEGIKANCINVEEMVESIEGIAYLDPPYDKTSKYGNTTNLNYIIENIKCPLYISEGMPLSDNFCLISGERDKGGISGVRTKKNEEWLSFICK